MACVWPASNRHAGDAICDFQGHRERGEHLKAVKYSQKRYVVARSFRLAPFRGLRQLCRKEGDRS
jgi:hypothetical protein